MWNESIILEDDAAGVGWHERSVLGGAIAAHFDAIFMHIQLQFSGEQPAIKGSSGAIITPASSFTSYKWWEGGDLAWRDGLGLAAYLYISWDTISTLRAPDVSECPGLQQLFFGSS